jgi:hypothetical protein
LDHQGCNSDGGLVSELAVPLRRPQPTIRTDEDTIDVVRRLTVHYPDAKIAGVLNRQGRHTTRDRSLHAAALAQRRIRRR